MHLNLQNLMTKWRSIASFQTNLNVEVSLWNDFSILATRGLMIGAQTLDPLKTEDIYKIISLFNCASNFQNWYSNQPNKEVSNLTWYVLVHLTWYVLVQCCTKFVTSVIIADNMKYISTMIDMYKRFQDL